MASDSQSNIDSGQGQIKAGADGAADPGPLRCATGRVNIDNS